MQVHKHDCGLAVVVKTNAPPKNLGLVWMVFLTGLRHHLNTELVRFVTEFRDAIFRHQEFLVSGIESGTISLHSVSENSNQTNAALLRTFSQRLRRLDRKLESEPSERYQSIRDDTAALCDGLDFHNSGKCDFWAFTCDPHGIIYVYVDRDSREVMGCVSNASHLA